MGCFPNSSNQPQDFSKQGTTAKGSGIVISSGLFVREEKGDPFQVYDLLNLLGEGGFGKVYKVRNKKSLIIRAMKIVDKKKQNLSLEKEKELIKEISILKELDHPNILKVFEFYNSKKFLYIISELCTGGELFNKIIEVKHFTERVAAHIMKQLLSAVSYCHVNNILHRDLKPENILIETDLEKKTEFFTIKVIDFGTSEYKKDKMLSEMIGSSYYIAPEVLNNKYNEKCDIWSCGVIMFILLCGRPPFNGKSDEEIFAKIKKGVYTMKEALWERVSDEAKDLISKLLTLDSSKRLTAQHALEHEWFKTIDIIHEKYSNNTDVVMKNLLNFHAKRKFQQAVLTFLVHNLAKREDIIEQRNVFLSLDKNHDGRLTKEEMIEGLTQFMTFDEAKFQIEKMMKEVDFDNNGFIEYEEFLRASYNKQKLLTEENLSHAFDLFDKDKNGMISHQELKKVIGGEYLKTSDTIWKEMIAEFDLNGDGEICFYEFKEMMNQLLEKNEKVKNV